MNNYGIVLEELGLSQLLDELMHKYLAPLADLVFPEWGGASLDHHHSFTIRYRHGEDLDLAQHMDASDVSVSQAQQPANDSASTTYTCDNHPTVHHHRSP